MRVLPCASRAASRSSSRTSSGRASTGGPYTLRRGSLRGRRAGSGSRPANCASDRTPGSSASASGLPSAASMILRRVSGASAGCRASSSAAASVPGSGPTGHAAVRASSRKGRALSAVAATSEIRVLVSRMGEEAEHRAALGVEPVDVVEYQQYGPLPGRVPEQGEDRRGEAEDIGAGGVAGFEGGPEHGALRAGKLVQLVLDGPEGLVQCRVR